MADTSNESGPGPLLKNRYRLDRVLGRGGMCIVYQAWDTRLQRNVAVKRLEPPLNEDPRTRARFDREGRALAQLSHPNLVTLIDRGSTENDEYLVFEYIEGRSLKDVIREGQLSITEAGRIAGQVAEGLAAAHLAGIVHRDVKPQNILIDRQGHAKVTDFGIATGQDWTRVTRAGAIIGSIRYMSPEQVRSKPVDARSDVYSLGVVMYEMLTGRVPFEGTSLPEIAGMHLRSAPLPLSTVRTDLPEGLEKLVMRCLEKLPEDRFVSMDELLGALVGLGLYAPQRKAEVSHPHRRLHRRGTSAERQAPYPPAGGGLDAGSGRAAEDENERWVREQARALARKRRTRRRMKFLGVSVAVVVVVVVIAILLSLSGAGAPSVVGLSLDEAQRLALEAGMTVEVTHEMPVFDKAASTVLDQEPPPEGSADDNVLRLTVSREPVPVTVISLDDADHEGDEVENPDLLPNLIDGKESTSWTTELYRSSAFGDLKTGVGIDFTLAEEATIIEIISTVEGWRGELLQNTSAGATARLATLDGKSSQIITLRDAISKGRIWFTELAKLTDNRWGVELSEVHFYR